MGTTFFHESHFQGLLERVRERGRANVAQRVADQVSRLFRSGERLGDDDLAPTTGNSATPSSTESVRAGDDSGVYISNKDSGSSPSESLTSGEFLLSENLANLERQVAAAASNNTTDLATPEIDSATNKVQKSYADVTKQRSNSNASSSSPEELRSFNVCVKLCSLIKGQLLNALTEVTARFGGQVSLSQAQLSESPDAGKKEEGQIEEAASAEVVVPVVGTAPLATCEEPDLSTEPEASAPSVQNGHPEEQVGEGKQTWSVSHKT